MCSLFGQSEAPFCHEVVCSNVCPVCTARPGCPKCPSAGITAVSAVLVGGFPIPCLPSTYLVREQLSGLVFGPRILTTVARLVVIGA